MRICMFWLQQKNMSNIHDLKRISPANQLCEGVSGIFRRTITCIDRARRFQDGDPVSVPRPKLARARGRAWDVVRIFRGGIKFL